uniref:Movement protein TGB2 n=1 Tax=Ligustrum virus A TaxID=1899566 RepID=A0A7S9KJ68_9VIRU|nr:triple gene block 2 [Ligustrum virus A]
MPLTPPPDNTRVYLCAAFGASLCIFIWSFSRSTLPFVGDNIHQLPHGGFYQDGTKTIRYNAPGKLNSLEAPTKFLRQPWAIVIALIAIIILLNRPSSTRCATCGRSH